MNAVENEAPNGDCDVKKAEGSEERWRRSGETDLSLVSSTVCGLRTMACASDAHKTRLLSFSSKEEVI